MFAKHEFEEVSFSCINTVARPTDKCILAACRLASSECVLSVRYFDRVHGREDRRRAMAATLFLTLVALGSIPLCFADQTDGDAPHRPSAPVQKLNGLSSGGHHAAPPPPPPPPPPNQKTPCTCGVFLSSQIVKGKQPSGYAALVHEHDESTVCNVLGVKTCTNKCLEIIAKHLPNSSAIICGSVDRDVYKERAHLFVKNCNESWINTRLSTGGEYCCKDGHSRKCNLI